MWYRLIHDLSLRPSLIVSPSAVFSLFLPLLSVIEAFPYKRPFAEFNDSAFASLKDETIARLSFHQVSGIPKYRIAQIPVSLTSVSLQP